jgi:hypothetical protein
MKILEFIAYFRIYTMGLQMFDGKGPFLLFWAGKIPVNGAFNRLNYCVMYHCRSLPHNTSWRTACGPRARDWRPID